MSKKIKDIKKCSGRYIKAISRVTGDRFGNYYPNGNDDYIRFSAYKKIKAAKKQPLKLDFYQPSDARFVAIDETASPKGTVRLTVDIGNPGWKDQTYRARLSARMLENSITLDINCDYIKTEGKDGVSVLGLAEILKRILGEE